MPIATLPFHPFLDQQGLLRVGGRLQKAGIHFLVCSHQDDGMFVYSNSTFEVTESTSGISDSRNQALLLVGLVGTTCMYEKSGTPTFPPEVASEEDLAYAKVKKYVRLISECCGAYCMSTLSLYRQ